MNLQRELYEALMLELADCDIIEDVSRGDVIAFERGRRYIVVLPFGVEFYDVVDRVGYNAYTYRCVKCVFWCDPSLISQIREFVCWCGKS